LQGNFEYMIHNAWIFYKRNMKNIFSLIKIMVFCLFVTTNVYSKQSEFLKEGIFFFEKKEFNKSKIFFEKDIVFNPKNEVAYLYLAKISKEKEKDDEEEMNLNNVLLLNPNNDEAIYMLTILKIKQSDYNQAKSLIDRFNLVCESFCSKKSEIDEKFKKLIPENAKNNN